MRGKHTFSSTVVAMVGAGTFTAGANGQITSIHAASGNVIVSFKNARNHRKDDAWHLVITGPGAYRSAETRDGSGAIRLVAEIVANANRSQIHACKVHPFGTLTLRPDGLTGPTVGLTDICGKSVAFVATVARATRRT